MSVDPARIASQWGEVTGQPRLVAERENAVYEVSFTDGRRAALRLHRPGYQTPEAIEFECQWTAALADAGFPCPRPIPTKNGTYLADGTHPATAIAWIDATPFGASGVPLSGSIRQNIPLFYKLGSLLARLHELSDRLALPNCPRTSWDLDGFTGDLPCWGRFWENPALSEAEATELRHARDRAREALNSLENPDFGLIHADALQENVLVQGEDLYLIDFDDAGVGYRLYDLGTALIQHIETPGFTEYRDALITAYATERGVPVSPEDVHLFTTLRSMASCGWIIDRADKTDPRQRVYAKRAVDLARRI